MGLQPRRQWRRAASGTYIFVSHSLVTSVITREHACFRPILSSLSTQSQSAAFRILDVSGNCSRAVNACTFQTIEMSYYSCRLEREVELATLASDWPATVIAIASDLEVQGVDRRWRLH